MPVSRCPALRLDVAWISGRHLNSVLLTRKSSGASRSARASAGYPSSKAPPHARPPVPWLSANPRAPARATPPAPCADARTQRSTRNSGSHRHLTSRRRHRRPAARTRASTESTFGTGWKTVREIARTTLPSHESCAITDGRPEVPGCPASLSPTSRCTIATHRDTRRKEPRSCAGSAAAMLYGRFATSFVGAGHSCARSSCSLSPQCTLTFAHGSVASLSGAAQAASSISTTCTCAPVDARYSEAPGAAADRARCPCA